MTRINAGIKPQLLTDKHLIAEHREIKRIPNHLAKFGVIGDIPKEFSLGTGHVKFFLDKGEYTHLRYIAIYEECLNRNFNIQNYSDAWKIYNNYSWLYNPWECPQVASVEIWGRLVSKDYYHYKSLFPAILKTYHNN